MSIKIFKVICIIAFVYIATSLILTFQYASDNGRLLLINIILALLVFVGIGCIFGAITAHIAKSKGYDSGFAWGFWLGVIGILVVGFRPTLSDSQNQFPEQKNTSDDIESLLIKLASLHDKGILTDEEYQQKKSEILKKV